MLPRLTAEPSWKILHIILIHGTERPIKYQDLFIKTYMNVSYYGQEIIFRIQNIGSYPKGFIHSFLVLTQMSQWQGQRMMYHKGRCISSIKKPEKERARVPMSTRIQGRRGVQKGKEEPYEKQAAVIIRTLEPWGHERTLFCSELKATPAPAGFALFLCR